MNKTSRIKVKVLCDWKGIPKGTIAKARSAGFGCTILEGDYAGIEVGKSKYKVVELLPETKEKAA